MAHIRIAAVETLSSLELDAPLLAQYAAAIEQLALRDEVMDVRQACACNGCNGCNGCKGCNDVVSGGRYAYVQPTVASRPEP